MFWYLFQYALSWNWNRLVNFTNVKLPSFQYTKLFYSLKMQFLIDITIKMWVLLKIFASFSFCWFDKIPGYLHCRTNFQNLLIVEMCVPWENQWFIENTHKHVYMLYKVESIYPKGSQGGIIERFLHRS